MRPQASRDVGREEKTLYDVLCAVLCVLSVLSIVVCAALYALLCAAWCVLCVLSV